MTENKNLNDGYDQPHEVSDITLAFPANLGDLLPSMEIIPEEFTRDNKWVEFQRQWFFYGWPKGGLVKNPDVDSELAYRHLRAIQESYEPKHEHKMAAVAWLASRWFEDLD